MNHHYRSCSEQLHPTIQINGNNNNNDSNSNNNNNNNNSNQLTELPRQDSFVRVYSDSQSSLDRLFDWPNIQASVPLRNRNLPASFFNPTWQQQQQANNSESTNRLNQHLHTRSISLFHQRPPPIQEVTNGNGTNGTASESAVYPPLAPALAPAQPPQQQPPHNNTNNHHYHHHQNIHIRSRSSIAPMTSGMVSEPTSQPTQQQPPPPPPPPPPARTSTNLNNQTNGNYFPQPPTQTSQTSLNTIDDVSPIHHCNSHHSMSPTNYSGPDLYNPLEPNLEPMQQEFHISHPQPYVTYDPSPFYY